MTRLLNQLPAYYKSIKDFRELSRTVGTEYDALEIAFNQVEDDQFILSSGEAAIARREKDFKILPDPSTETLNFRKKRILARMQESSAYTIEYLREAFDTLLGAHNTELEEDIKNLKLLTLVHVESASFYLEVQKMLERIVPLNVELITALLLMRDRVVVKPKQYTFPVYYPITNTFQTADVPGRLAKGHTTIQHRHYEFDVHYPICGTFLTSTVNSVQSNLNVELANEYREIDVFYKRAGQQTITGEGEI